MSCHLAVWEVSGKCHGTATRVFAALLEEGAPRSVQGPLPSTDVCGVPDRGPPAQATIAVAAALRKGMNTEDLSTASMRPTRRTSRRHPLRSKRRVQGPHAAVCSPSMSATSSRVTR
jgi:hypothetical protein